MKTITLDGVEYNLVPKEKPRNMFVDNCLFLAGEIIVSNIAMSWENAMLWCQKEQIRPLTMPELLCFEKDLLELGVEQQDYWSSSELSGLPGSSAWFVYIGYGYVASVAKSHVNKVIGVR